MKRSEKKELVEKLKDELDTSSSVIVAHYSGLTVNESEQLRSSRAMIRLLRDRGFEVLPGSQNKHFVQGLGVEAEETETWVN